MDTNTLEQINATAGNAEEIARAAATERATIVDALRTAMTQLENSRQLVLAALAEIGEPVQEAATPSAKSTKSKEKRKPRVENGEIATGIFAALRGTRELRARDIIAHMEKNGYKNAGSSVYVRLNAMVKRGDLKASGKRHDRTYRRA